MRIFRENIVSPDNLLVVKEESFEHNDFPFHFHPEYEIILILESSGQRFVGDSITNFNAVDLCMFGSNLPHKFHSKGLLSSKDAVSQVVIQFHENFLGMSFFDRKPFQKIRELLDKSTRGICFTGETREMLMKKIIDLPSMTPAETIIEVLQILHTLSMSHDYFLLSSPGFTNTSVSDEESSRMNKVYDYIVQNFKRDLTLDEVAAIAYLSPSAFCRYFKKFTRKTLSEFLIDFRIGYACKLLQGNNMGISQISGEAGFNNVSYFNRKFKAIKGKTPMEYQRHFLVSKVH
ncbi:AraC family transcriptional regulator [Flavitalea sp. BT771]|uniref:AraC family transcriptional regulator n=1 Tax=Flavitalea sp. BT771 TaxID=3063329 RepID=UPI0026E435A1|nr:AraC family transcriptional regulator [Flavitalea sp. BT771]MDO6435439.1 AraC family transcriptional regulator [Flavitalea sp. BT771]MDV6224201.1 AraC family transcriptional regulator [Flavitalea sp. BT771]